MKTKIKKNIRGMKTYFVPQAFDGVKLNQNESPLDIPKELKENIFRRLDETQWNRYPKDFPGVLTRKIADYTGFPEEGILVANSSNELIQTIIYACCDSGDQILTVTPTFSVYRNTASVMNIETLTVPLNADFSFDTPAIIKKIGESEKVKAVILASPNNPTGTVLGIDEIEAAAKKTPGLLVIDEAYFEFYGESAQSLIEKYGNIIILRTFSKALRSAGIRLGYLLARETVVNQLKKVKLPFSVGIFQQVAGEVILENRELLLENIETTLREREQLYNRMQTMPFIQPVPSKANFILFRSLSIPAGQLYRSLRQLGILVRAYDGPGMEDMLRVAVGTPAENAMFLGALSGFCNDPATRGAYLKEIATKAQRHQRINRNLTKKSFVPLSPGG